MGLTNQEIEELDAFLLSDDGRENAMDVSGVDGFLCAVLSGPNVIMPSAWMRWVWDSAEGKQSPEFTSEKQAQRILDLLMRHANDIAVTLTEVPQYYEPLFLNATTKDALCRLSTNGAAATSRALHSTLRVGNHLLKCIPTGSRSSTSTAPKAAGTG